MALDYIVCLLHPSSEPAVLSAVDSLKLVYTIVISLSIAETFKQFVNEPSGGESQKHIQRDRLPAVIAFVCLAVPFIHGMNRYFFDVYSTPFGRPDPCYSGFLLFDTISFTVEAVLFFVLSRSLPRSDWYKFYTYVALLLAADIIWGSVVNWSHTPQVGGWLLVNAITLPFLAGLLWWHPEGDWLGPSLGLGVVLVRTALDYWLLWPFYFP